MRRSVLLSVLAISLATTSFVSVDTAFAGSHTTAQAVNPGKSDRNRPKSKLSVDLGTSFANPKSNVVQSNTTATVANVNGSSSKNITSIGIDYRVPLFLVLANLGNVANLGCPDCRADIANAANIGNLAFRPKGPVVGLWGRVFFGGDDQNEVGFDLHPTPGIDTFSAYSKSFFILPYIGYVFGMNLANNPADLTFFVGPRLERRKIKFRTDQGSGFVGASNSETDVGLTVGADLDIPLPGLFNVGYVGSQSVPFVRVGAAWDWSPSIAVSGTTTGPAFNYNDRIKSGGTFRLFFGGGVKW